MNWKEYLEEKNVRNGFIKSVPDVNVPNKKDEPLKIDNESDYNSYKRAIEDYEKETFKLEYEDFEKIDKCFNKALEDLEYSDEFSKSDLYKIEDVMHYLDWTYVGKTVSREMLANTVKGLFEDAVNYASEHKVKRVTTCSGGWNVTVDFRNYSVHIYFYLADTFIFYEELNDDENE